MGGAEAVSGMDRLPWLSDDTLAQTGRRGPAAVGWAIAAIGLALGAGVIGLQRSKQAETVASPLRSTATIRLPEARPVPVLDVPQTPLPTARTVPPPPPETAVAPQIGSKPRSAAVAETRKPVSPPTPAAANGRIIQIGAFGSPEQAMHGWAVVARAQPAIANMPVTAQSARNSKGRSFYRFQLRTASQAQSEVLCQRMQQIRLSCAVIGLPWKSKVER